MLCCAACVGEFYLLIDKFVRLLCFILFSIEFMFLLVSSVSAFFSILLCGDGDGDGLRTYVT